MKRALAVLFLGVLSAIAAGCTNSETLNSGVGNVAVNVAIDNSNTRFAGAFYTIQSVAIEPLDPDAAAAQGDEALFLISSLTRLDIDQNQDPPLYVSDSPLTAGFYRVVAVTMNTMDFFNGTPANDGTCPGSITDFSRVSQPVNFTQFDDPGIVEVRTSGDNQLVILIDGQALVTAFQNSWLCVNTPSFLPPIPCTSLAPGCTPVPDSQTGFVGSQFAQEVNSFLSFP